jgi:hypothetical protein
LIHIILEARAVIGVYPAVFVTALAGINCMIIEIYFFCVGPLAFCTFQKMFCKDIAIPILTRACNKGDNFHNNPPVFEVI